MSSSRAVHEIPLESGDLVFLRMDGGGRPRTVTRLDPFTRVATQTFVLGTLSFQVREKTLRPPS